MAEQQTCGLCLRFNSIVENFGKCRLLGYELKSSDDACQKFVNDIQIEKDQEAGWFVILTPSSEKVGPFRLFNDIDCVGIGESAGIKPKEVLKAILKVPPQLVEGFDIEKFKRKELEKISRDATIKQAMEELKGKNTYDMLLEVISRVVKEDLVAKQFDLLHCLSAYAEAINELKEAPTSEGKTYPTMQILNLFPRGDVWRLGGLSPTALAHDFGQVVDEQGNPLDPELKRLTDEIEKLEQQAIEVDTKARQKIRLEINKLRKQIRHMVLHSERFINLENKIICFLDNPHPETWARLRPIMSHDVWRTTYKFTDRVGRKGPLKQFTAHLVGFPVFIAFKAETKKPEIWDQILSRGTTVPVEMSTRKYRKAIKLQSEKKGLPQPSFERKIGIEDFKKARLVIEAIKKRLLEIKEKAKKQSRTEGIPNLFWIPYYNKIGQDFPAEIGTHMRESQRFLTIIQMHASANVFNRPILEIDEAEYIICTVEDYAKAMELFFSEQAKKVIFSKIPKYKIDFFEKVILPLFKQMNPTQTDEPIGITSEQMGQKYIDVYNKPISSNTINYHYLRTLEEMNFITRERDPTNKSRKLTIPLKSDVFEKELPIETHFKNGCVLTLEELKEAFNRDIQSSVSKPPSIRIKNFDGSPLSLEQFHEKFMLIKTPLAYTTSKAEEKMVSEQKSVKDKPVLEKGVIGRLSTQEVEQVPKTETLTPTHAPTLTQENFEKVVNAIKTIEDRSVYATLPQLAFSSGMPQSDLKEILKVMEKEGRVFQYKEGAWKLAK